MCWKSQPPQPSLCAYLHGAVTRSADGVITSTTSARLKLAPTLVTSISTDSPGIAWRTKITAPSWRAMKWPPWATFSISTLIRAPTSMLAFLGDDIALSVVEINMRKSSKLVPCT